MKGLSEVIATILMLMVTIALSATAYLFISNSFIQQMQAIEVLDAFCTKIGAISNASILIRNYGTTPIDTSNINVVQTFPDTTVDLRWDATSIPSGGSATVYDLCEGSESRTCTYRLTPPQGRTASAPVRCTS